MVITGGLYLLMLTKAIIYGLYGVCVTDFLTATKNYFKVGVKVYHLHSLIAIM